MKKIVMGAILLLASMAWADEGDYVLYWQIVQNDFEDSLYASVGYTTDGGQNKTYLTSQKTGSDLITLQADGLTENTGSVIGKVSPTAYSFFVELYSDSATVWTSSYYSYSQLADFISKPNAITGGVSVPAGTWAVSASVPEPTSGLLLLMGLAGLALRRRRAAV